MLCEDPKLRSELEALHQQLQRLTTEGPEAQMTCKILSSNIVIAIPDEYIDQSESSPLLRESPNNY